MEASQKRLVKSIPVSRMVYPDKVLDKLKYYAWLILAPVHPYVRNVLDFVGFLNRYEHYRPNGRQRFLLGTLAPSVTPEKFVSHLVEHGYGNHFVALKDREELIGLRYTPDFAHQYHLRLFKDGEVRGHFEFTTECHPFLHDKDVGVEERREDFLLLLGDLIVPAKEA